MLEPRALTDMSNSEWFTQSSLSYSTPSTRTHRKSELVKAEQFLQTSCPAVGAEHKLSVECEWRGVHLTTDIRLTGASSAEVLMAAEAWTQLFKGINRQISFPSGPIEDAMAECGKQIAEVGQSSPEVLTSEPAETDKSSAPTDAQVPHKAATEEPEGAHTQDAPYGCPMVCPTAEEEAPRVTGKVVCASWKKRGVCALYEQTGRLCAFDHPGSVEVLEFTHHTQAVTTPLVQQGAITESVPLVSSEHKRKTALQHTLEMLQDDNLRTVAALLNPSAVVTFSSTCKRLYEMTGWPVDLSQGFRGLSVETVVTLAANIRFKLLGCSIHGGTSPMEMQQLFYECTGHTGEAFDWLLTVYADVQRIRLEGWRHSEFPLSGAAWPLELKHLVCDAATQIESLEGLVNGRSLTSLTLSGCHSLQSAEALQECDSLQLLSLAGCSSLTANGMSTTAQLTRLRQLTLTSCFALTGLPELPPSLLELHLERCLSLADITPIESCPDLRSISIIECGALSDLAPLSVLYKVKKLDLTGCGNLTTLSGLLSNTLEQLNLSGCRQLEGLEDLSTCSGLKVLKLSRCVAISDFGPLNLLNRLEQLDLSELSIDSIPDVFSNPSHLTALDISQCAQLRDLSVLSRLPKISELLLCNCARLQDLAPVASLVDLKVLKMSGCTSLVDLTPIGHLTKMKHLSIDSCDRISDIAPLGECTQLRELQAAHCSSLSSATPLRRCSNLKSLDLSYCGQLDQSTVPEGANITVELDWLARTSCTSIGGPFSTPLSSRSRSNTTFF